MARTGENIYKRKDGRWEARYIYEYSAEGKAKYHSVYGISRQQAKQKRLLLIHETMLGKETAVSPIIIFKDLVKNWLNNTKLRVKESTYARYCNQVNKHILPHLGKYQALKISTELIEQLIGRLLKAKSEGGFGLSPKTVEDIFIIIKSILRFGKCHSHLELHRIKIKKDSITPITLPKIQQSMLHRHLVNDVNYVKAGILLSMHTGIRIGELCALQWKDVEIDFNVGIVHINKTLQRIQIPHTEGDVNKTKVIITPPKSKKSIRDIHIPSFLTAIFRKMKKCSNDFVLTGNAQFMEPRTLHNHFKRFLKQSAVGNYNFHSLRHTFATNYIEAGYDYKSLSEILGHSNVKITLERYVDSSNELKRNNIEKLVGNLLYLPSELPSAQSILTV